MRTRGAARQIGIYFNVEILRHANRRWSFQISRNHRLAANYIAARLVGHIRIRNMALNHPAFCGLSDLNLRSEDWQGRCLHNER